MRRYNEDLLKHVIERDNITVNFELIKKLNSTIYLDFICKCGKPGNKTFRLMFEKGSLCRECTINLYNIRHKASLKEHTGFEHPLQCKEILQKKKDTCMERFNVEHPTQCKSIKEKTKQTCIKRYNCEFVSQVKETREKIKNTWFRNYGVYNPLQSDIVKSKVKNTCLRIYGVSYSSQSEISKIKLKNTNLKKYGVTSVAKLQKFKDKREQTCLKKYGVTSAIKLQSIKDKRDRTSLKKYGVTSAIKLQKFKDKREKTCLLKYGVKHSFQNQIVKQKSIKTCLLKYGVKYISQAKLKCNFFKFKEYIFPCGTKIFIQGYEPYALDELVSEGYGSLDILTCRSEVPDIWYFSGDNKKHRYFVDIYLPEINKMIEVKSVYTFNKYKENVLLKAKECINQGYNYEIWVYDNKKNKTVITEF